MHLPEIFPWGAEYGTGVGKQMLLVIISVVIIAVFFILLPASGKLVPGRLQFLGEFGYGLRPQQHRQGRHR